MYRVMVHTRIIFAELFWLNFIAIYALIAINFVTLSFLE